MDTTLLWGLLIPFSGTVLGAAMVFLMRDEMSERLQKILLGFASGVMIAASVWSLLIPSINMATEQHSIPWLPAAGGFLSGMVFLLLIDTLTPHLHLHENHPEGLHSKLSKRNMLFLAVTIHNVPEGMAVGVVFAGMLSPETGITNAAAVALAVGIAIQNIPEGAIVSMPMKDANTSKLRAFSFGALSGVVEPVAAVLTLLLSQFVVPAMPVLLAFAAGAMIYVVVDELIPESQAGAHSNLATIGVALGFTLMMILDVALG